MPVVLADGTSQVKGSEVVSRVKVSAEGHGRVGASCSRADEADLQAVDLAEPAFAAGFRDAGVEVVADLDQSRALDGVGLRQRTC